MTKKVFTDAEKEAMNEIADRMVTALLARKVERNFEATING